MMGNMPYMARQFITFCGVGAINTLAGLAMILTLSEIFGLHYMLANFLGYCFGLLIGFVLHRSITFRNEADRTLIKREFVNFVLIFAIAYLVQLGALYVLVEWLGVITQLSQILAIGIYTLINYFGNKVITFRGQKESAS